jgi:hypothetical protein
VTWDQHLRKMMASGGPCRSTPPDRCLALPIGDPAPREKTERADSGNLAHAGEEKRDTRGATGVREARLGSVVAASKKSDGNRDGKCFAARIFALGRVRYDNLPMMQVVLPNCWSLFFHVLSKLYDAKFIC